MAALTALQILAENRSDRADDGAANIGELWFGFEPLYLRYGDIYDAVGHLG